MPFPVERKYVAAAEAELGVRFPSPYAAKLTRCNGGALRAVGDDWDLFPVFDKSSRKRITRTANHIVVETKSAKEWDWFPREGVAIGQNGTGDKLVLLPDPEHPATLMEMIFWWDHETGECHEVGIDAVEVD
jgi:hypothetical protein